MIGLITITLGREKGDQFQNVRLEIEQDERVGVKEKKGAGDSIP